ncbi:MAG TPA: ParB/RepB/Spo0J family partition protein [Thermomicrobiales bacterium]|nr:ParB/RepB/Spo0J family partition protein [Thermomicrobiales bacterium]
MAAYKQRLGRGLAALIGDDADEDAVMDEARGFRRIPIELLHPNPHNPRRRFDSGDLDELVQSIRAQGVLQPLIVRPRSDGQSYEIVAGERRWRAAQRVPLHEVPALVRDFTDGEALEIALIENVQRADLNALEEAQGYAQLIEHFGYTQQQLASSIGKSRSHIANSLRLLSLPDEVKVHLESGALTAGHARTLVASAAPAELAQEIIKLGLSVREAERLTQTAQRKQDKPRRPPRPDADTRDLERRLGEALGLKIEIVDRGDAGGRLTIHYRTLEQLDEVSRRLAEG